MHTIQLRMKDGTTKPASGPRLRVKIEGRYRYFVVHPTPDYESPLFSTITEERSGLRLTTLHRPMASPAAAKRAARQRVHGLLEQGLGPRIHTQIEVHA